MSDEPVASKSAGGSQIAKKIAKNVALNMIPGYPLIGVVRSIKQAAGPGAAVISDLSKQLPHKRSNRARRSWNEAMAARPIGALPLRAIERRNTHAKWIFMVGWFFALCAGCGCAMGGKWMGTLNSVLFMLVCTMQMFKHELRLRQMETGPAAPDSPLMSAGEFFRSRGFTKQLFDPRLKWK